MYCVSIDYEINMFILPSMRFTSINLNLIHNCKTKYILKNLLLILLFPLVGYAQTIDKNVFSGMKKGDQLGRSVSLSEDGRVVAIGIPFCDLNGDRSGQLTVYRDSAGVWVQMGHSITGMHWGQTVGETMTLSRDGKTLAIGGSKAVTVFRYDGNEWNEQITILPHHGKSERDFEFINDVSLSADGNTLAFGSDLHSRFYVQVYKFANSSWDTIGVEVNNESNDGNFGDELSLSAEGNRIAISAPGKVINGVRYVGQVKVF
ncbi:MAG: hypothetical protein ABUL44_03470, partial [Flavobacterium sp.]